MAYINFYEVSNFMKLNKSNLLLLAEKFHIHIDKERISDYELLEANCEKLKISIRDNKSNITYIGSVDFNFDVISNANFFMRRFSRGKYNDNIDNFSFCLSNINQCLRSDLPYTVFSVEYEKNNFSIRKEYVPGNYYRYYFWAKNYDQRSLFVTITSTNEKKIAVELLNPGGIPLLSCKYSSNLQSVTNEARYDNEKFYFRSHYSGNTVSIRGGNATRFYHPFCFSFTNNYYSDKNESSVNFEFNFPKYGFSWIALERKYFVRKTDDNNIRKIEFIEQSGENKSVLFVLESMDDSDYLTKDEIKCVIEKLSSTYKDKTQMDNCIGALKVSAESIKNNQTINQCPIWGSNSLFSYLNYVSKTDDEIFDFIVKNKEKFFERKIEVSPSVNDFLGLPVWESYHEINRKNYTREVYSRRRLF